MPLNHLPGKVINTIRTSQTHCKWYESLINTIEEYKISQMKKITAKNIRTHITSQYWNQWIRDIKDILPHVPGRLGMGDIIEMKLPKRWKNMIFQIRSGDTYSLFGTPNTLICKFCNLTIENWVEHIIGTCPLTKLEGKYCQTKIKWTLKYGPKRDVTHILKAVESWRNYCYPKPKD